MTHEAEAISQKAGQFFDVVIDASLITVAVISSLISLTVPCLFYIKKECRQHPTVLIANISLLEAVANYNIILIAYSLYTFQDQVHIIKIFSILTFGLLEVPDNNFICQYNFYIFMFLELLSMSFHICFSVDLLITLKFPFLSGKKRRKFYYLFSIIFPILVISNSVNEAQLICADELRAQSVFVVPLWFLFVACAFCLISIIIVIFSLFRQRNHNDLRKSYIRLHRMILLVLVCSWICPIWANILQQTGQNEGQLYSILNIISFFAVVSSSGIVNVLRFIYDPYLWSRIKLMLCFQSGVRGNNWSVSSEAQITSEQKLNDDAWNLPLANTINQFQSQQIVHNIIQVVLQACSNNQNQKDRRSVFQSSFNLKDNSNYDSVFRNTVIVESEYESQDKSFFNILKRDNVINFDPNNCTVEQLKNLSKRKRKFNMICLSQSTKVTTNQRLKSKTVHIKGKIKQVEDLEDSLDFEETSCLDIKVTSYCHRIFEAIRQNNGYNYTQLETTLNLEKNITNIKKAKESLGASGSFFFFSFDHRLVIKTIVEEEKDRLIRLLPYYFDHLRQFSGTLLAKTYGLFSVEIAGVSKIYFIMMQNAFQDFQKNALTYRIYDMKGSTVQREVKDQKASVLKDINYFNSNDCFIYLSKNTKNRLMKQVKDDILMLKKHNIMDYSLLLGVANSKVKKSKRIRRYSSSFSNININKTEGSKASSIQAVQDNWKYVTQMEEISNRVYCLSIIDYLQEFNWNKRLQLWLKKIFKGGGDISSVNTETYYHRFINCLYRIVLVLNINISKHSRN